MTGRKTWASDDILSAADIMGYLMDQSVTIWANSSARNSGILAPIEGQICYLQDVNVFESYTGSGWSSLGGAIGTATYAANAGTAVYASTAGTATNASKVSNQTIFIQSSTPTANATNDLWFW